MVYWVLQSNKCLRETPVICDSVELVIRRKLQRINCVNVFFRVVYDRVPYRRTLAVFVLSAFWHGFYPGYYMAFFTCGLMVEAGRKVCNLCPQFLENRFAITCKVHIAAFSCLVVS